MANKKIWFITGAGRGMGVEFAKAALAAGDAVVATGRDPGAVTDAVGKADDLLVVKLDVTSRAEADAAVQAAVRRFGRIDPGRVFDFETDLDGIAAAYAAMDERRAVKSLVHIGTV